MAMPQSPNHNNRNRGSGRGGSAPTGISPTGVKPFDIVKSCGGVGLIDFYGGMSRRSVMRCFGFERVAGFAETVEPPPDASAALPGHLHSETDQRTWQRRLICMGQTYHTAHSGAFRCQGVGIELLKETSRFRDSSSEDIANTTSRSSSDINAMGEFRHRAPRCAGCHEAAPDSLDDPTIRRPPAVYPSPVYSRGFLRHWVYFLAGHHRDWQIRGSSVLAKEAVMAVVRRSKEILTSGAFEVHNFGCTPWTSLMNTWNRMQGITRRSLAISRRVAFIGKRAIRRRRRIPSAALPPPPRAR